jgi:peptidyl-prolyl cis-trans isomerase SurA
MQKRLLSAAMAVCLVLIAIPLAAAQSDGVPAIAAVVNDEVVSTHDLGVRTGLLAATGAIANSAEARQQVKLEVLRLLVDERLKLQEARRLNISVSPQETEQALTQVSRQLQVSRADLDAYLMTRGSSLGALLPQIESELMWLRAVSKIAGERVAISEDEVDQEVDRLKRDGGGEARISEIFIAVDDPGQQAAAEARARRIAEEARSGANFATLARTFSQSASAEGGGDIGWVRRGQLDPRVESAVDRLAPGQVSEPVRTEIGYYVIFLADRRSAPGLGGQEVVSLSQVVVPLSPQASDGDVATAVRQAQAIRNNVTSCDEFREQGRALSPKLSGDVGKVDMERVPPQLRQAIGPLQVGQISQPIRNNEGIVLLMVCGRESAPADPALREAVQRRLMEQRLTAVSRQQLRELRRTALIDYRL